MIRILKERLGRDPSELEISAAREAALVDRLAKVMGRPPREAELAVARDAALKERAAVHIGRPPTEWEMSAAREADLKVSLDRGGLPLHDERDLELLLTSIP